MNDDEKNWKILKYENCTGHFWVILEWGPYNHMPSSSLRAEKYICVNCNTVKYTDMDSTLFSWEKF